MFKKLKAFLIMLLIIPFSFMFAGCKDKKKGDGGKKPGGTEQQPGGEQQPGDGDDDVDPENPEVVIEHYNVSVDFKLPEKFAFLAENITDRKQTTEKFTLPTIDANYSAFFDGWYSDAAYTQKITGTQISGTKDQNLTVYAKWKETEFKNQFSYGGLKYSLDSENNIATVTGFDETSEIIVIPGIHKVGETTYFVRNIGASAFANDTKIKKVITYSTGFVVENNAFKNSVVEEFDFETVKSLGDGAFAGSKVKSVKLARTFEELGTAVFEGCAELTSVDMSAVINEIFVLPNAIFKGCAKLASVKIVPTMNVIGANSFEGCASLEKAEFLASETIDEIQNSAFKDAVKLNNVVIGTNVTSLGGNVFDGCVGLKKLTINRLFYAEVGDNFTTYYGNLSEAVEEIVIVGNNVLTIESQYFEGYSALKSFTMSDTIVSTGILVFDGCEALETINFSEVFDMSQFDKSAFEDTLWYKNQSGFIIANNVLIVGPSDVAELIIPDGVVVISEKLFKGNKTLTSVSIPASVREISGNAFQNCSNLQTVTFAASSNLEKIGSNAFYGCSKLTSINTEVCTKLAEIGNNAFNNVSTISKFVIPASIDLIGENAFHKAKIQAFEVAVGNENYAFENGVLYALSEGNKVSLVKYLSSNTAESFAIPSTVTSVGKNAFYSCTNLKFVLIDSADEITFESNAFDSCRNVSVLAKDVSKVQGIRQFSGGFIRNVDALYDYIEETEYTVVDEDSMFKFTFNFDDVSNTYYYVQFEHNTVTYTYLLVLEKPEETVLISSYIDISGRV